MKMNSLGWRFRNKTATREIVGILLPFPSLLMGRHKVVQRDNLAFVYRFKITA
jgi:hypothetical protein